MATIWDVTQEALSGLGVPVVANALIVASGASLPDVFVVYSLVSSPPIKWADDFETMRFYRMQVSIYSRNGLTDLPDVSDAMVAAGFARGPMRELPYNQETRHFGLALEFIFTTDSESEIY